MFDGMRHLRSYYYQRICANLENIALSKVMISPIAIVNSILFVYLCNVVNLAWQLACIKSNVLV